MSVILRMIDKNHPLHAHERYLETGDGLGFCRGGKNPAKYAQSIFGQLSHPKVQELVAEHFDDLPQQIRIELRTLCNGGNATGNVRKGVQRLNTLLGGKLLREAEVLTMNRRRETADGVRIEKVRINPAIAGATRKYQRLER